MNRGSPSKNNPQHSYIMGDQPLSSDSIEKDVGVTFDLQLTFKEHIRSMIAKANSRIGLIKRSFVKLTIKNFKLLYKSLVRPILEYCSTIWNPHYKYLAQEIEKVQRRATKVIHTLKHLDYSERLKKLNITTLFYRRKRSDMLQVFRLFHGFDKIDINQFFTVNKNNRGHEFKLVKKSCSTNIRANSFSLRVFEDWNNLPQSVVNCKTINTFKNALEKHWSDDPVKYDYD